MYPIELFGALLSVDQHAPVRLTGCSMHSEALGPQVYFKHKFNNPQNTLPFIICTDAITIHL